MTHKRDLKQFLVEFDRGDTHKALAERYGVDRGTIRSWLKAAGRDPSANVKKRRAAKEQARVKKLRKEQELEGKRIQCMAQLQALAKKHKVKPLTLAHWAERTGYYTPGVKVNLRAGRPRRLPRHRSTDGVRLAREVERACNPWTPRHVAGLIRQRLT